MKIVDAKVFVCSPGRNFVTLKITTDEGVTGLGDATLNGRELAVASYLTDHVLLIEEVANPDTARRLGLRHPMQLSGLYEGIPLNLRSVEQSGTLPERITLYRRPIIAEWQSARFSLEQLVSHIVIHEVGHHFGFSDDEMHALEDEAE